MEARIKYLLAQSLVLGRPLLSFGYIARLLGTTEEKILDFHKILEENMECIEKDYYIYEYPKVKKSIEEMKNYVPKEERDRMRSEYLEQQIALEKQNYLKGDEKAGKKLKSLLFRAKIHRGEVQGITPEVIARALTFPIERLVEHRNFMALCPFHNEKTPSMNIKNNYYYCHACGATGDVIQFVMDRDGVSFATAVNSLVENP